MAPAHVRAIKVEQNTQKLILCEGIHFLEVFSFLKIGNVNSTMIDIKSAKTPPSFLGIDRRIA
jgi:hypothetical protein